MGEKAMRRDAEKNRALLLASAKTLFAERGLSVGLNEIARQAGVGVGTAYRHFADKEALIDTLFEQRLNEVAMLAEHALELPDPWEGLVYLLDRWLQLHATDRASTRLFTNPDVGPRRAEASRDRIAPLLESLAGRVRDQGRARSDFSGSDIFFVQLALAGVVERSHEAAPDLYRRYLAMFLEGIRTDPDPGRELPVASLDTDQTHGVMTRPEAPRRKTSKQRDSA